MSLSRMLFFLFFGISMLFGANLTVVSKIVNSGIQTPNKTTDKVNGRLICADGNDNANTYAGCDMSTDVGYDSKKDTYSGDLIVRTGDAFTVAAGWNITGSNDDVTITSTLPSGKGLSWSKPLNGLCADGSSISDDGLTLTCIRSGYYDDTVSYSEDTEFGVDVSNSVTNDTDTGNFTFKVSASGANDATDDSSAGLKITATPRWNLQIERQYIQEHNNSGTMGYKITYPFTIEMDEVTGEDDTAPAYLGSENLGKDVTIDFTADLNASANTTLVECLDDSVSYENYPLSYFDTSNSDPIYANHSVATLKDNLDLNCTQENTGDNISVNYGSLDLTMKHIPTLDRNNRVLPITRKFGAVGAIAIFVPYDDISTTEKKTDEDGDEYYELNVTVTLNGFDPDSVSGTSNFGGDTESLKDNSKMTTLRYYPDGKAGGYYLKRFNHVEGSYIDGDGLGIVTPGTEFTTDLRINNTGTKDFNTSIICDVIDSDTYDISKYSDGSEPVKITTSHANPITTVEYAVGYVTDTWPNPDPAADNTADVIKECSDSSVTWYSTFDEAKDAGEVTKVRVKVDKLESSSTLTTGVFATVHHKARGNRLSDGSFIPANTYLLNYMAGYDDVLFKTKSDNWYAMHKDLSKVNILRYPYYSDRVRLARAKARIDATLDTTNVQIGDTVHVSVKSTLTSDNNTTESDDNVTVTTSLYPGITYVPSSSNLGEPTITDNGSVLVWDLGTRVVNQPIPDINYSVHIEANANKGELNFILNEISAPSVDPIDTSYHNITKNVNVNIPVRLMITKSVLTPFVDTDTPIEFESYVRNGTSDAIKNIDMIDTLPFIGDGTDGFDITMGDDTIHHTRTPATNYNGTLAFSSAEGKDACTNDIKWYYSNTDPRKINLSPKDDSNKLDNSGSTNWCAGDATGPGSSCGFEEANVTAVRMVKTTSVASNDVCTLKIKLDLKGNKIGDIYTNTTGASSDSVTLPVISNDVYATVPTTGIGDFVWLDKNKDGIQDSNESGVEGIAIKLLDVNNSNNEIASITTDSNGFYKFTGLNAGNYKIKVDLSSASQYAISSPRQGGDSKKDSDIDSDTNSSEVIALKKNQQNNSLDIGLFLANTAPTAVDSNHTMNAGSTQILDLVSLLTDPDTGDTLSIISINDVNLTGVEQNISVPNGEVRIDENGTITFVPNAGFTGDVTFPFEGTDGTETVVANVNITVIQDTDGDGITDDIDLDDDNDGILDINEIDHNTALTGSWKETASGSGIWESKTGSVGVRLILDGKYDKFWGSDYVGDVAMDNTCTDFSSLETIQDHTAMKLSAAGANKSDNANITIEFFDLVSGKLVNVSNPIIHIGRYTGEDRDDDRSASQWNLQDGLIQTQLSGASNFVASSSQIFVDDIGETIGDSARSCKTGELSGSVQINGKVNTISYNVVQINDAGESDGNSLDNLQIIVEASSPRDTDGDTIPDYLDLDSDNDGIPDNVEAQTTANYKVPSGDVDKNGTWSAVYGINGLIPIDTDDDNISDVLDLDSDNDGKLDKDESGLTLNGDVGKNGLDNNVDTTDDYSDVNGKVDNPNSDLEEKDSNTTDVDYRSVSIPNTPPVVYDNNQTVNAGTVVPLDLNGTATDADGDSVMIATINGETLTGDDQNISVPNGIVHIDTNGTITLIPDSGFTGTITFPFEGSDGTDTSSANVNVVVKAIPIDAVDDNGSVNGLRGGVVDITANDTLNNVLVKVEDINITLTGETNLTTTPKVEDNGSLVIPAKTSAGEYYVEYKICENLNPDNCDEANATVDVSSATIIGHNDTNSSVNGSNGGVAILNIAENDTLNGKAVKLGEDVNITNVTNNVFTIDPKTGAVTIPVNTPAGNYVEQYTLCEILNPNNCVTRDVNVTVVPAPIDALNDDFTTTAINGLVGGVAGDVTGNDLFNGLSLVDANSTLTLVDDGGLTGVTVADENGSLTVPSSTPAGTYNVEYKVCENLNPDNCDEANATVKVEPAIIKAVNDTNYSINGLVGGVAIADITDNDTLNGTPFNVAVDANITEINNTTPLEVNQTTGKVSVPANTKADSYTFRYRVCENLNPTNCADTNVTVDVLPAPIKANSDNGSVNGSLGGVAVDLTDNDLLNSVDVVDSDINTTLTGETNLTTTPTIDENGSLVIAKDTPNGIYYVEYQICELLNPTSCDEANATVDVSSATIIGHNDTNSSVNGSNGGVAILNIAENDTLNGKAVKLGEDVNITDIKSDGVLDINRTSGEVTVPKDTPAGDYSATYTICENLNPNNCVTRDVNVTVVPAPIDAVDDDFTSTPLFTTGGVAGDVTTKGNDTLNGIDVDDSLVTLKLVPSESNLTSVSLDNNGTLRVHTGTEAGSYNVVYQLCEALNPTNCDKANVKLVVLLDSDGDGIADIDDLDDDNDGILDSVEEQGVPNLDTDGDGVPDRLDLDSDNDGILDLLESGQDPSVVDKDNNGVLDSTTDKDNDGVMDSVDADDNNPTSDGIVTPIDTDGDSIRDFQDVDSDNDGMTDLTEVGISPVNDEDNDGMIDGAVDTHGIPTATTSVTTPLNTDGDKVPNYRDLDSDNDGLTDVIEAGLPDSNGDGLDDTPNGTFADPKAIPNQDGDELVDPLEPNNPNLPSEIDGDGDGVIDDITDSDNDGIPNITDEEPNTFATTPVLDSDNDGIADVYDLDDDNDGILDTVEDATASNDGDTDGDGVPDRLDLDSDNDGILDLLESGQDLATVDTNNDGILDSTTDKDNDGVMDSADADDNNPTSDGIVSPIDTDGDNKPDFQDVDSDNDSLSDMVEAGILAENDSDSNGMIDGDVDDYGIPTTVEHVTTPVDTDEDGTPNYRDLDSDNDGLNDVDEVDGLDENRDALVDIEDSLVDGTSIPDSDGDDTPDVLEPNNPNLPVVADENGDGVIDNNIDTDGDGIPDITDIEDRTFGTAVAIDSDGDGIADAFDIDDDNDGIVDIVEAKGDITRDTDGDGVVDSLDLDSDNDGILDIVEALGTDTNNDGRVDDAIDTDKDGLADIVDSSANKANNPLDEKSGRMATLLPIPDTDKDKKDDFQDVDSDNDGLSDLVEAGVAVVNDEDNNGMIDGDVDSNGVPTATKSIATPLDSDNDGLPDYRELDSDNDGKTDVVEAGAEDVDHNGLVDTEDELIDATNLPDEDSDDIPDYREVNEVVVPPISVEPEVRPDKRVADLSEPVTVEVLQNDKGDLNNSSVWIELPKGFMESHPEAKLSKDKKSLVVPKEGTWTVNIDGTITYRAEKGSTILDPTPISYSVADKQGKRLKTDALIVLKGTAVKNATDTAEDCNCNDYNNNVSIYENWVFVLVTILGSIFGLIFFRRERF